MKRLLALVALLLLFAAPAFAVDANGCYSGTTGAVMRWSFNTADVVGGNMVDKCASIGGNTTGTIDGATSGFSGKWGEAFYFDGGDRVYNTASADPHFAAGSSFSYAVWLNTTTDLGAGAGTYFCEWDASAGATAGWVAMVNTPNDDAYWVVKDLDGDLATGSGLGGKLNNGTWISYIITWNDTSKDAKLYLNGNLIATDNDAAVGNNVFYSASSRLSAGAYWKQSTLTWLSPFVGYLDEAQIYNYTLSPTEITTLQTQVTLYTAGPTVTISSPANSSYDNVSFEDAWYFTPVWVAPGAVLSNCSLFANSTYQNSTTTLATGVNTSVSWSPTTEGQYSWYVSCYDSVAGTWSANSSSFLFYYDTTNPSATVYSPAYGGTYYAGTATPVNITYTDTRNMATCAYEIFNPSNATFKSNSTSCSGTSYNWATDTFTPDDAGTWYLNVTSTDSAGNSAVVSSNFTVNGLAVDVFNEKTFAAITCWNMSITNSTGSSYSTTCQNNTWVWSNFSTVPTGAISISITAVGFNGRTYYRTYAPGIAVSLDAYLLDTSSGVYSYFLVQSSTGTALYGATIAFTFQNGTSWLTAGEVITDSTGSATMWLDWTKTYLVTASLTGYTTVSKSLTPQPTTYLIIMGSTSVFNYTHLNDSLWTFIDPTDPEVNITTDSITAGLLDPDSSISICGLNLTFVNGTVFSSTNTTTEAHFCVNTIPLLGSGALATEKFYAVLWYTVNGTSSNWSRLYVPLNAAYSLGDAQSGLFSYLGGTDARLILAVLLTLCAGAAAAMYLGIGATIVMMGVSGLFFYWGWFAPTPAHPYLDVLYIIVFVAGAALLYLETRT